VLLVLFVVFFFYVVSCGLRAYKISIVIFTNYLVYLTKLLSLLKVTKFFLVTFLIKNSIKSVAYPYLLDWHNTCNTDVSTGNAEITQQEKLLILLEKSKWVCLRECQT